ncbi:MAG: helix-turn-helix transcriptional regulator [Pseudomonadota bacterium]
MDANQCRAARALLGLSQDDLAYHSTVAKRTIASFEKGNHNLAPRTLAALVYALNDLGVEFIAENGGGAGVRLRK